MKRIWSSRIWTICSQMLYCGLLLEDVQVHLGVKGKRAWPEGHLAEDTCKAGPPPAQQAHCSRGRGAEQTWHSLHGNSWVCLSSLCRVCVYLLMSVFWKRNRNFSLISKLLSTKLRVAGFKILHYPFRAPWHITAQLAGTSISLLFTCEI